MVELENLKDIWKQHIDPTIDKQNIEKQEIERLLKGRSTSILEKLKRNLLLEIAMFVVCLLLVAAVPFYFNFNTNNNFIYSSIGFYFYSISILLHQKIQRIK
ncbi:MAG: hypothetical protein IPF58_05025 [Saprospirales bacterium]|nr:hypothetical protein [Saprospirales bacterium]